MLGCVGRLLLFIGFLGMFALLGCLLLCNMRTPNQAGTSICKRDIVVMNILQYAFILYFTNIDYLACFTVIFQLCLLCLL